MAQLQGYSRNVQYIPGPVNGAYATGPVSGGSPTTQLPSVIDGTPVRVVVLALAAAAGLTALHWAGLRFSLGVTN